jgi:hypothetical protein
MRTLGPHSVSSVLKIILDVVFVLLFVSIIVLGARALLSAAAMANNPAAFANWYFPRTRWPVLATTPRAAAALVTYCFNILASIVVVGRLRKIFVTLIAGAPFQVENARRLRVIGLALMAAEVSRLAVRALIFGVPATPRLWFEINFVGWFSIAIIFVLAEIFEEGARLRREAELTI